MINIVTENMCYYTTERYSLSMEDNLHHMSTCTCESCMAFCLMSEKNARIEELSKENRELRKVLDKDEFFMVDYLTEKGWDIH